MTHRPNKGNGGYFMEEQNDELVDGLSSRLSALKSVTIAIGDEEFDMESSLGVLGATMRRLGVVSKAGGKNVLCYLVGFAFFVFLVIYFMMR